MYLADFSLNNLSLMALTIATGFVVDDAIVMIENISRYLEQGDKPLDAALKGAEQIGFTIISLTVSLVAVLIPLLFMQDVVGRLFREFAVTLAVTILISAVVSLTLVPMMCARLLRPHAARASGTASEAEAAGSTATSRWYAQLLEWYGQRLTWVLDHQSLTLGVAVGTLVLTALLYIVIPKGFFPDAGHRRAPGRIGGHAIGVLRGHGRSPAGAGIGDPQGSRCREPVLVHRRRRQQRHAQQRTLPDQPQAPQRALRHGRNDCAPHPERDQRRAGHHAVPAARAGPDARCHHQPHAIPVHAAGLRHRAPVDLDATACRGTAQ